MERFQYTLEQWYGENRRDLPWRMTDDPYCIWISEIILQQTRVAQGLDYYRRFVDRFPNVYVLAAASEDEVLHLWQGLGFYSRARNLHCAARQISANGGFPSTYKGVRALKGVGDYTAAAICSIAYGQPYAVVDGNVYRVLSRLFDMDEPIDTLQGKRAFQNLADSLLDRQNPGLYNQAIMDFGAMQCAPQSPRCVDCPFAETCLALAHGTVEQRPVKTHQVKVRNRYFVYVFLLEQKYTYLWKRSEKDIWQGLYQPLLLEFDSIPDDESVLKRREMQALMQEEKNLRLIKKGIVHQLTHQKLAVDFYVLKTNGVFPESGLPSNALRVLASEVSQYAFPRPIDRVLASDVSPFRELGRLF